MSSGLSLLSVISLLEAAFNILTDGMFKALLAVELKNLLKSIRVRFSLKLRLRVVA